uniref:C-type lectin domain-containing protein n=1 Tax=Loxodonta africana TaxID=9785 RepID=G3TX35_LOXAF
NSNLLRTESGQEPKKAANQTQQEITYVELNLHSASQDLQKKDKSFHCKGLPFPPGKLIAGILGIICTDLMASVITVAVIVVTPCNFLKQQHNVIVIHILFSASHCGRCPEDWLSYSNNCYYISSDKKTWTESQMACASKKSNLIYIDNEEEMKFMNFLPSSSWIGLFRESPNYPWFWINVSPSNQNITEASGPAYGCGMLFSFGLQSASCGAAKVYICKLEISS